MENSPMKIRFLYFITSFTICIILGYLSHDLVNGIRIGIGSGIGVVIGMELGKRREKRKQRETENNTNNR
jgi:hypothetical protein